LYQPGTDRLVQEWVFSDFFPLECSFADSETVFLSGAKRALVLNRDGEISVDLSFDTPICRTFHSEMGFALLSDGGELSIYGKNGELIGIRQGAENIRSVLVGDETVYMMTDDTLMAYQIATGESAVTTYTYELQKLLWYSEDELLICSRSTARYASMGN
jgi:hypothetical protein